MYTIRTITQTGKQTNRLLGEVYTYGRGFTALPLYKGNKYYVVSPNGQTFSNLSNY